MVLAPVRMDNDKHSLTRNFVFPGIASKGESRFGLNCVISRPDPHDGTDKGGAGKGEGGR